MIKFKSFLNTIDDVLATIALLGVVFLTITNVISRYVFNHPLQWAEEVALALFIWLIFLGVSSTMKRKGHIEVDFFVNKFPKPLYSLSRIIRAIAIYYALIYVFIYLGYELTSQAAGKATSVIGINYKYIDVAIPLGGILMTIFFTKNLINDNFSRVKKKERGV